MADAPPFNPNAPFDTVTGPAAPPPFDPNKPFEPVDQPAAPPHGTFLGALESLGTGAVQWALQQARGEQIESEDRARAFTDQPNAGPPIPTGDQANQMLGLHQPTGFMERGAEAVGSNLVNPGSWFGPGGWIAKGLMAVGSGVGSEAAGEAFQGTSLEMPARIVGGMAAGPLAARAIKPTLRPDQQALADAGVTMTPGQLFPGPLGWAKDIEDRASSFPILGSFIKAGRQRSVESFNRAVGNQALEPIGERLDPRTPAGHETIGEVEQKLGDAYDNLLPSLHYIPDRQFAVDMNGILRNEVNLMPAPQQAQFHNIVDTVLGPPAPMNGAMLKNIESELTARAANYSSSQIASERDLGRALNGVIRSIRSNLERSNPAQADELSRINAGWAMFSRMRGAAARRATSDGVFTPSDLLAAIRSGDKSVARGAFARGDALMQAFGEAGQRVLPSKVGSSGTTERASLIGGLAAAAHYIHEPHVLAGTMAAGTAATLPYTRPGMWAVNRWAAPTTGARAGYAAAAQGPYSLFMRPAVQAAPFAFLNPYAPSSP